MQNEVQGREQYGSTNNNADNIMADKAKFKILGMDLSKTCSDNDNQSRDALQELLNEFLLLHGDHLQVFQAETKLSPENLSDWKGEMYWGKL